MQEEEEEGRQVRALYVQERGTMKRVPQAPGRVRKEVEGEVRKGRGSCGQEMARISGEPRQGPEERPGTLSLVSGTG